MELRPCNISEHPTCAPVDLIKQDRCRSPDIRSPLPRYPGLAMLILGKVNGEGNDLSGECTVYIVRRTGSIDLFPSCHPAGEKPGEKTLPEQLLDVSSRAI